MQKIAKLLTLLVKRWTSKSPKLFVRITNACAFLALLTSIALLFSASYPAWLVTILSLLLAFSSGFGINSKITTTDSNLENQT